MPADGSDTGPMDFPAVAHIERPARRIPRPGDLLVAAPSLIDPNFRRAVVLLLSRDDEGAAGVVINRRYGGRLTGIDLPEWVLEHAIVHEGGPVATDALLALADADTAPEHLRRAAGAGICVVDIDALADAEPFHPLQLFVGYAGWSPGQLDQELARDDWLVVPCDRYDVLGTDPEAVWARVMRRQRDLTQLWATLPDSVAAN